MLGLLSKVKEFVVANTGAVTAAGVAGGVATAAAVAAVTLGGGPAHKQRWWPTRPRPSARPPRAPAPSLPTDVRDVQHERDPLRERDHTVGVGQPSLDPSSARR